MKMSEKINIEKLIEAVRLQEFLWNTSDPDYRDTQAKAEEWQKISAKFGVPADTCRRKWKCLRDAYRRELRKLNADPEPDGDNLPKWRFFSRLEFLQETVKPFIEQSKTRAKAAAALAESGMEAQNDVNGFEEDLPYPSPIVQAYFPKTEYVTPHNERPSPSSPFQPRVDDGLFVVKEEFLKTMKFVQQYLSDSNGTGPAAIHDDEDELFCRSMLCKLKKLPLPEKNMVKMQIMALLNRQEEDLMNTASETNHCT